MFANLGLSFGFREGLLTKGPRCLYNLLLALVRACEFIRFTDSLLLIIGDLLSGEGEALLT